MKTEFRIKSTTKTFFLVTLTSSLFLFLSCKSEDLQQNAGPEYLSEINQWHQKRIENLKKENGWLNLVGLFWLKEGENKIGSARGNDIILPEGKAPVSVGKLFLNGNEVTIKVNPNVVVFHDSLRVNELKLENDESENPTILSLGSLRWFIIKRGEKIGVRVRDLESPLLKNFSGIDRFPVNVDWKIEAKYEPYDKPRVISIPTIIGTVDEDTVGGKLIFKIKDKTFSLDPVDSGDKLFIIFADETNGKETYGAGRFLYADKPDSSGRVILDFNKAYNPPCVFTKYATCPLPPQQNRLKIQITAGEKNWGKGH